MPAREHVHLLVDSVRPVVASVPADALQAPTPCEDWDVRALANHMLGTVEAMRRIAAGEDLDPVDPWGTEGEHMHDGWQEDLDRRVSEFAQAWSQESAWEGEAMDGTMPRAMVGDMAFVEVMLHGWDLARATGQEVVYDAATVDEALAVMERIGGMGRSMGAFGAEVDVPDDAGAFELVLARAGRDPAWTRS